MVWHRKQHRVQSFLRVSGRRRDKVAQGWVGWMCQQCEGRSTGTGILEIALSFTRRYGGVGLSWDVQNTVGVDNR